MTFVKINEICYPAIVIGKVAEKEWDGRATKAITLEMEYETAFSLFVDGLVWQIVTEEQFPVFTETENGQVIQSGVETKAVEYDNSEYCLAGDITNHRDGTVTIKMGKLTDLERAYELLLGGN